MGELEHECPHRRNARWPNSYHTLGMEMRRVDHKRNIVSAPFCFSWNGQTGEHESLPRNWKPKASLFSIGPRMLLNLYAISIFDCSGQTISRGTIKSAREWSHGFVFGTWRHFLRPGHHSNVGHLTLVVFDEDRDWGENQLINRAES